MNDEIVIEGLCREVDDLLRAGPVGLYEFLEILRGMVDPKGSADGPTVAQTALDRLLTRPDVGLQWDLWDGPGLDLPAERADVDDAAWRAPTDAPYLCVVRL